MREKPAIKKARPHRPKRKPGRPKKGENVLPRPPKRLDIQPTRTLAENLLDLPSECNVGTKKNSKGYKESWTGYKLHMDCIDGDIPVSTILTSASLHDSQAAIPLAQLITTPVGGKRDIWTRPPANGLVKEVVLNG